MKSDPSYAEAEQAALDRFAVEVASNPSAHPKEHVQAARARLTRPAGLPSLSPGVALAMSYLLEFWLHVGVDDDERTKRLWHLTERAIHVIELGDELALQRLEAAVAPTDPQPH